MSEKDHGDHLINQAFIEDGKSALEDQDNARKSERGNGGGGGGGRGASTNDLDNSP